MNSDEKTPRVAKADVAKAIHNFWSHLITTRRVDSYFTFTAEILFNDALADLSAAKRPERVIHRSRALADIGYYLKEIKKKKTYRYNSYRGVFNQIQEALEDREHHETIGEEVVAFWFKLSTSAPSCFFVEVTFGTPKRSHDVTHGPATKSPIVELRVPHLDDKDASHVDVGSLPHSESPSLLKKASLTVELEFRSTVATGRSISQAREGLFREMRGSLIHFWTQLDDTDNDEIFVLRTSALEELRTKWSAIGEELLVSTSIERREGEALLFKIVHYEDKRGSEVVCHARMTFRATSAAGAKPIPYYLQSEPHASHCFLVWNEEDVDDSTVDRLVTGFERSSWPYHDVTNSREVVLSENIRLRLRREPPLKIILSATSPGTWTELVSLDLDRLLGDLIELGG